LITAIDSNILIDVLVQDFEFAASSEQAIDEAVANGAAVISEPVFAELAARFRDESSLREFLRSSRIRLELSNTESLYAAGVAWARYSRNRPEGLICPDCGGRQQVACSSCSRPIQVRQHVLSDFLIGAHAREQADFLLTRDRGYFRTYFPDLKLV
jgi:predicted nucleic acid-binding protein